MTMQYVKNISLPRVDDPILSKALEQIDEELNKIARVFIDWTVDAGANNIHDNNILSSSITQHEGDIDHDALTNTHDLTTDIDHDALTNFFAKEHRAWEDSIAQDIHDDNISSSAVTQHEGDIDHNALTNYASNQHFLLGETLTTAYRGDRGKLAYDHIHNLTTDIDHDALTNFVGGEHFLQSAIITVGTIATGVWQGTPIANAYVAGLDQDCKIASNVQHNSLTTTKISAVGTSLNLDGYGTTFKSDKIIRNIFLPVWGRGTTDNPNFIGFDQDELYGAANWDGWTLTGLSTAQGNQVFNHIVGNWVALNDSIVITLDGGTKYIPYGASENFYPLVLFRSTAGLPSSLKIEYKNSVGAWIEICDEPIDDASTCAFFGPRFPVPSPYQIRGLRWTLGVPRNATTWLDNLVLLHTVCPVREFLPRMGGTLYGNLTLPKLTMGSYYLDDSGLVANNKVADSDKWDGYQFADYLDQSVKQAASPTLNDLTISTPSNIYALSHNSFADYAANRHVVLPGTIANVLSNHTKAVHDSLKIEGGYLGAPTELTINAGAITVTGCNHRVDTQGDAGADDLDTINGFVDGMILVLRAEHFARTITVKDADGNIELEGGLDMVLDNMTKKLYLFYDDGTVPRWVEMSRFNG